jgi:hypothetical protein
MAKCITPGVILDCGEGHGCYIISDADTHEVLAVGCASDEVKLRRVDKAGETIRIDINREIVFCCNDVTRQRLSEVLADVIDVDLLVPTEKGGERLNVCMTTTMGGAVREIVGEDYQRT